LFVSALSSKREEWMRMRRIGRMQEQLQTESCKSITADFHGN
jgi:hypothetical protein